MSSWADLIVSSGSCNLPSKSWQASFVFQGNVPLIFFGGLWLGVAGWLLRIHDTQDGSQTRGGTSAKSGWFDSTKWLLQSAIQKRGSLLLFARETGRGLCLGAYGWE